MHAIKPEAPLNADWTEDEIGTGGNPRFYPLPVVKEVGRLRRFVSKWELSENDRLMLLAALQEGRDIGIYVELGGTAFLPNSYPPMRVFVGQPPAPYLLGGEEAQAAQNDLIQKV